MLFLVASRLTYQHQVTTSNSDYYPENPFDAVAPGGSISSEVGARYGSDTENFEIPINTYSNMTIGLPESSLNVEDGDELARK